MILVASIVLGSGTFVGATAAILGVLILLFFGLLATLEFFGSLRGD